MQELSDYLTALEPGVITDTTDLQPLLASSWHLFVGSRDEGMAAHKLSRIEKVVWQPPLLSLELERHGRTAAGSTRADIQRWELNLQERTACCEKVGFRQLRPMQARLNVKPLAEDIAKRIVEGQKDERVKWNTDGTVRVIVAKVIPDEHTFKQTLTSRRKRFRLALEEALGPLGWQQIRRDTYKKVEEVRS